MEDILSIYKRPYDADYPVVCMDESNKHHHRSVAINVSAKPGRIEKFDTHYERNGYSNIFLSFEPLAGKRFIDITARRTRIDWAKHIQRLVEKRYPKAKKIILVLDNLNTHTGASLYEALEPAHAKRILDKIEFHYTPKNGSWLNMAEIEFSHLFRQCLCGRISDREYLTKEIQLWVQQRNEKTSVVDWRFTTDDARIKLKNLYPTIAPSDNTTDGQN